jgi:hypothetical protein
LLVSLGATPQYGSPDLCRILTCFSSRSNFRSTSG